VFTHDFGLRNFRFAAGLYAPYSALPTYDLARSEDLLKDGR